MSVRIATHDLREVRAAETSPRSINVRNAVKIDPASAPTWRFGGGRFGSTQTTRRQQDGEATLAGALSRACCRLIWWRFAHGVGFDGEMIRISIISCKASDAVQYSRAPSALFGLRVFNFKP